MNYRSEPYKFREEQGCSLGKIFQPCVVDKPEDPATPTIEAHAGDPVRIHVIGANSEQNGMFAVEGHEWPIEPYMPGADMISVVEYAGSETLDVFLRQGAGGPFRQVGDYPLVPTSDCPTRSPDNGGTFVCCRPAISGFSRWALQGRVRGKQKHNRSRKGSPQRCNRSGGFWWGLRARVHSPQAPAGPCRFLSGRVQA